ncbi:aspartic and glutamic acid-rich protein-like [Onthophagus taurus]|uniref:aspartic and glutamic acid-rich protein-like n=1 Tax=Onthophagus taurus TaxID=166361 RepID=UPI0039BEABB7
MIPMLSCLFCKRKRRLFNIYKIYGRTERPITSYIISFFGDVEEYLKEDHGICSTCVLLLNKLIYIKNFMVKTIIDDTVNSDSYVSFSAAYKLFLHNLDKLNFDDGDSMEDGGVSDLLKPMHSTPCEIDYDYSSDRNTPYIDKEVEKVFRPSKRKRRRSTKSTIDDDTGVSPPCLRYDEDGRLLNKRTRSVSRLLNAMQEDVDCGAKEKENFERDHVSHHELLAKYFCCECRSDRFTSLDFVHHKASEEMTSFYRIDYNDHPNNNSKQVTTGDFHVKVLIQKGKINDSPILRFQESPEVITPSLNTSLSQSSQQSDVEDSELDTGQENSSITSEKNETNNSSITSSEDDIHRYNEIELDDKCEEDNIIAEGESLLSDDDKVIEESKDDKIEEESEDDKIEEESEDDKVNEENVGDKIEESEDDKVNEENLDDKIEESEDDEENSCYIPSALEPERMVRDIIDTSSSESESPEDLHKMLRKRELKVDVTRMIIDEALLTRLNRFPIYQRRRRSGESRSSGSGKYDFKNNLRTDTEYDSFDSD